jgi:hypothetical protein
MLASLLIQIIWLFVLAIPIACISWTVTHEEVFREPREYCQEKCKTAGSLWVRKFFYLFTCEYCFSHYVTAGAIILTGYKLLLSDWRGYIIAGFALVWIANIYMSLYNMVRVTIKEENLETKLEEKQLNTPENK